MPDFLVEFAHAAIDNGADVFLGQGVHTLRGIEIYKGKPIFYGLSNFAFYMNSPVGGEQANPPGDLTRAERNQANVDRLLLSHPDNMEALLAVSRFERGRLVEVRVYPVDVGKGYRPISKIGIPMMPTPEMAREILEKVQRLSKPFGTNMTIENGVGVIRVASLPNLDGRRAIELSHSQRKRAARSGEIARPIIAAERGPEAPSAQKSMRKLSFISRAGRISRLHQRRSVGRNPR